MTRRYTAEQDAGLETVVDEAVRYGQYDIALSAAKRGGYDSNRSNMLVFVARCMAHEGWYQKALDATNHIPYIGPKRFIRQEIFDLQQQSLQGRPPPNCRQSSWLRAPNDG